MAGTLVFVGRENKHTAPRLSLDSEIIVAREKYGRYKGFYSVTAGNKNSTDRSSEHTARREVSEELGKDFSRNFFKFVFNMNRTPIFITYVRSGRFVQNRETEYPVDIKLRTFYNNRNKITDTKGNIVPVSTFLYRTVRKLLFLVNL